MPAVEPVTRVVFPLSYRSMFGLQMAMHARFELVEPSLEEIFIDVVGKNDEAVTHA